MNRSKSKYKPAFLKLPDNTEIEVVAIKGSKVVVTKMTYGDFLKLEQRKGWVYTSYQIGFSQFKES